MQIGDLQTADLAVHHERGDEKQECPDDAPRQADERDANTFAVPEEGHQEEQGDREDLQEKVERHQVRTQDRADEAGWEERQQIEEPCVVAGLHLGWPVAVERLHPVVDIPNRVHRQCRAQQEDDRQRREAEPVGMQAELNGGGHHPVLLRDGLPTRDRDADPADQPGRVEERTGCNPPHGMT